MKIIALLALVALSLCSCTSADGDIGDFLKLQPRCLEPTQTTLVRQPNPGGWIQLVAK